MAISKRLIFEKNEEDRAKGPPCQACGDPCRDEDGDLCEICYDLMTKEDEKD